MQELKNVPYSKFAVKDKETRVDAETLRIASKLPEKKSKKSLNSDKFILKLFGKISSLSKKN